MSKKTQYFVIQVLVLSIYTFMAIELGISLAYLTADYAVNGSTLVFIITVYSLVMSLVAIGAQWIIREIIREIDLLDKQI